MLQSFFWSNYRLTILSDDYLLKWLHQEYFLGNFLKAFRAPKYHILQISKVNLFLVAKVTSCGRRTFPYKKQVFPSVIFFQLVPRNFLVYNVSITMKKRVVNKRATSRQHTKISQF